MNIKIEKLDIDINQDHFKDIDIVIEVPELSRIKCCKLAKKNNIKKYYYIM